MSGYPDSVDRYNVRKAIPTPGKTALLVIDMQRYFEEIAAPILENVIALVKAAAENNVPVIFTRHGHRNPAEDGGMLGKWWGDLIRYGSPDWEFIESLPVGEGAAILDKNRYSAFFNTDLEERLRAGGIEDVVIAGVLTNCCCETTARDAFMRDFSVFFVADATAATEEELHTASLMNLAFGFSYIVSTAEVIRHFHGHTKRNRTNAV